MAQRRPLPFGVALQQVFDDEAASEAGGAVDDEIEGFGHGVSPFGAWIPGGLARHDRAL